jgi:hypothetical protein
VSPRDQRRVAALAVELAGTADVERLERTLRRAFAGLAMERAMHSAALRDQVLARLVAAVRAGKLSWRTAFGFIAVPPQTVLEQLFGVPLASVCAADCEFCAELAASAATAEAA